MACGAPVITSNTSSLPEVVGDAALQVDPHDIDALSNAMLRLLDDEGLREELRQKGYEQIKDYTWAASARKMLTIYQKLYNGETVFTDDEVVTNENRH
jgi:glycosyltransferase involved in cell wall biosynthesis